MIDLSRVKKSIMGFMDQTDPTRDVKLAAFAAVAISGIIWHSIALAKNNWAIYPAWADTFKALLYGTGLGSLAGEAVKILKKDPPCDPKPGDTASGEQAERN
jgi:hypothetical protein